jgi:hypothetical protein
MGFNEAAGNFQTSNFGRGGTANDAIQADAQDGDGRNANYLNNANFQTTGVDGSAARVQMYMWSGPNPRRDGDLDASIVFHELTHGTSIRMHGGTGALGGLQSGGMGEGWSDFFALSLLSHATDNPRAPYAFGPYSTYLLFSATYTSNYYYGIRRYPYCADTAFSPFTFADIDPNQISLPAFPPRNTLHDNAAGEVHNIGEVWCNMLMDARAAVWAADGPSANRAFLQTVTDAMALSVSSPTFSQARDVILQADLVNHAGAHRIPLWTAFAHRGLGFGAVSPPVNTSTGVVESFLTPFRAQFDYPDGLPTHLDPGVPATFRVNITAADTVSPVIIALTPGTERLLLAVNGAPAVSIPLTQTAPNQFTATIPAQPCRTLVRFNFTVGTSMGDRGDPPAGSYALAVSGGVAAPFFADDFETDTGNWTIGPNTAVSTAAGTGIWTRGDPVGTAAQPEDDHTPGAGVNCWFTGQGDVGGQVGAHDVDGGYTTLVSPAYDLSTLADARISYWRWYSNGAGNAPYSDVFRVDVSTDNGGTWLNAETIGPASSPDTNPGWRFASWSLSGLGLAPTSGVRLRFTADDAGSGSIVEAAIDDLTIESLTCINPTTCPADFNHDGAASVQDIFDFLTAFFANSPAADVNNSTSVTVQDIFDYLAAYFTGC